MMLKQPGQRLWSLAFRGLAQGFSDVSAIEQLPVQAVEESECLDEEIHPDSPWPKQEVHVVSILLSSTVLAI